MTQISYLVNGREFLDAYMLREELKITKSQFQYMNRVFPFPVEEICVYRNKKLYSIQGLTNYLKKLLEYEKLKNEINWQ